MKQTLCTMKWRQDRKQLTPIVGCILSRKYPQGTLEDYKGKPLHENLLGWWAAYISSRSPRFYRVSLFPSLGNDVMVNQLVSMHIRIYKSLQPSQIIHLILPMTLLLHLERRVRETHLALSCSCLLNTQPHNMNSWNF